MMYPATIPESPSMFGFSPESKSRDFEDKICQAFQSRRVRQELCYLIDARMEFSINKIKEELSKMTTDFKSEFSTINRKLTKLDNIPVNIISSGPDGAATNPMDQLRGVEITAAMLQADRTDQSVRRAGLKISGLLEERNEKTFDLSMKLFNDMKVDVRPHEILRCYRLGKKVTGRTRPVLIVFTSVMVRNLVIRSRKVLYQRGSTLTNIHINEDLTPARSTLLFRCRDSGLFKSCWSFDGEIYVKSWTKAKTEKGDRIFCEADMRKYPTLEDQLKHMTQEQINERESRLTRADQAKAANANV